MSCKIKEREDQTISMFVEIFLLVCKIHKYWVSIFLSSFVKSNNWCNFQVLRLCRSRYYRGCRHNPPVHLPWWKIRVRTKTCNALFTQTCTYVFFGPIYKLVEVKIDQLRSMVHQNKSGPFESNYYHLWRHANIMCWGSKINKSPGISWTKISYWIENLQKLKRYLSKTYKCPLWSHT